MLKNIFIIVIMALFLLACQTGKEEAKKFSDEYSQITAKLKEKQDKVKTRDEYVAFKAEQKREFETLLQKFEKSPAIEEIEILRSKALLKAENPDEAEKKIDQVLAKNPTLIAEAKMAKTQILLERKKYDDAYNFFKDIETQVKDPHDLYYTYYYLGSVLEDNKVKKDYSEKFLNSQQLPEDFKKYRPEMFANLASAAKQDGDYDKARRLLNEGIAETKDEGSKKFLENTLAQLDYYGKPAFPLTAAGTWLNSDPLQLKNLKGQVVIISFWAPWCPSCRTLTPSLVEIYNNNKDKGFTIIGYTRFYGKYEDDVADLGKMTKEEELENIKKYLERKQMTFPITISEDKTDYTSYKISGIPTLVIIDKKGNIDYTKIGGSETQFLKDKIKKLLEES